MTRTFSPQGIASSKPELKGSNLTAGVEGPCNPTQHKLITEFFGRPYTHIIFGSETSKNDELYRMFTLEHKSPPDVLFSKKDPFLLVNGKPDAIPDNALEWMHWSEEFTMHPYGMYAAATITSDSDEVMSLHISKRVTFLFIGEDFTAFQLRWGGTY